MTDVLSTESSDTEKASPMKTTAWVIFTLFPPHLFYSFKTPG